jgi:hypothetical protein
MGADTLLSRLNKVKRTGPGKWIACCPAHQDHHPSMGVRELDDGRVLIRCYTGCSVTDILSTVGLEFDALFPRKPIEHAKPERRPFLPSDVFEIAKMEVSVVAIIAADMHKARAVSDSDYERLMTAANRLANIAEAAYER